MSPEHSHYAARDIENIAWRLGPEKKKKRCTFMNRNVMNIENVKIKGN